MGVQDPAGEARWMLEEVSGMDTAEQIAEANGSATGLATVALDALLARRAAGEPIQYVLGAWNFCGLDVFVDRRVLIPRPETEVVVQHAIHEVERLGERVGQANPWTGALTHYAVADLGTGSGALALALAAALPDAEVWATDASDDALAVAQANIAASGNLATRVRVAHGSWFDA
jgi:release factor glutamine methyltransferase